MNRMKLRRCILPLLLIIALLFPAAAYAASPVGEFSGAAAVELNHNIPALSPDSAASGDFISYSEPDALGRPGAVTACLSRASLSSELRRDSAPLPAGWVMTRYTDTEGRDQYLYRVCALLSPALGGDASTPGNVFTGTRMLRDEGMQLYEDMVAGYLSRTANHVLYRVTPAYNGDDLVPFGVQMEALSVEDSGRSVRFNVFLYNVEPGFTIDYRSGEAFQDGMTGIEQSAQELLNGHNFPAPTAMTAPRYGTFEALYEAFINSSGIAPTQLSTKMLLWISETGDKYHSVNPCGNMDPDRAHQVTVDLTRIDASQLCETCCQPIIQALPSIKASAAANARAQSTSTASLSLPRRAWAVKNDPNDRVFHKTDTCSETNNPTAYTLESLVKAREPCEVCWTAEEYNFLMAVHNGTATLNTSTSQSQSGASTTSQPQSGTSSASNTQAQSTSTASQSVSPKPLPTPAPVQSAAPKPLPTPAPSEKPNLLSLGSSLLTSALSPDTAMIWISSAEKVYHSREDCSKLDALFAYQKTLDWANAHGYEPCPDCW